MRLLPLLLAVLVSLVACGGAGSGLPPRVQVTSPADGALVTGIIPVVVHARPERGNLARVEVFVNGVSLGASATEPLQVSWDTRSLPGGQIQIVAVATDDQGEQATATQSVIIAGGVIPSQIEAIYSIINQGTLVAADRLLDDVWDLGARFKPAYINPITWTEDPFNEEYWRFLFYSLRPTANLLWAYYTTHDTKYRDKLVAILESYLAYDRQRSEKPDRTTFDEKHCAGFRAMVLVNTYQKLKRSGDLDPQLDSDLQFGIYKLGAFLEQPVNYDSDYNHGFTEAAALLLIAANFPQMDPAPIWLKTAVERLDGLMSSSVDPDGVEIEKSPFYHFYVLTFASQIDHWAQKYGVPVSPSFGQKTAAMSRFALYITEPNGQIPLIGSSVKLDVQHENPDLYELIGSADPEFEYVRTAGAAGTEPTERNVLFPSSGTAVLRSGFGSVQDFASQTHIVLNVGPYRTAHSHLDGLSITYSSAGRSLIVDSGLYTYVPGKDYDYFFGTRAHNTVVVDGQDQAQGGETEGLSQTGDSWAYQSGSHALYSGVTHARSVLLLQKDLALVIDTMTGVADHDYAQTWHLFPGAAIATAGLDVTATDAKTSAPQFVLRQAVTDSVTLASPTGQADPMQGWYSAAYGNKEANIALEYHVQGNGAQYVTLIASGPLASAPSSVTSQRANDGSIQVSACAQGQRYDVRIRNQASPGETVAVMGGGC